MSKNFGAVAETYEDIRPGYPAGIADDIMRYHGRPIRTVADVGAGTGKGTRMLLALGGRMICVEPDARMARSLPASAEVFIGTFEQWSPPPGGVDVLASAMAWHWTDEATRLPRAVAALASGGTLAIFGHQFSYVYPEHSAAIDATFAAQDALHGIARGEKEVYQRDDQFWAYHQIAGSGLFERIECHATQRDLPMTGDEYVRLVSTFSQFLSRPEEQRQSVAAALRSTVEGLGGTLLVNLRTTLALATPRNT